MACAAPGPRRPAERRVPSPLSDDTVNFLRPPGGRHPGARRGYVHGKAPGHKVFMAACDLLDENDKLIGFGEVAFLKKGCLPQGSP